MTEVFIVISNGTDRYYLLKIVLREFDVYCIPPYLGVHYTVHESGDSHFRLEEKKEGIKKEPPVILQSGEAGELVNGGIIRTSLKGLGRATGICTALYPIDDLSNDFQKFNRSPKECFVIDKGSFSKDIRFIEIGIWAVPERNEDSFKCNNQNIPADLLYKVAQCEPQIWIYTKSLV